MTATASIADIEARLRERLPAGRVAAGGADFAVDGLTPPLAVRPASVDEVAAALEAAYETGAAVVPWGGGAHMGLGMPPTRYDLALDLRGLDQVLEYEAADLTVTVEAGIRLSGLQTRLAERGQWLPLDPPGGQPATIGGILAVNASGPARVAFGTARDLVIGMSVVTADGRLVKSGGRVVKNVAGYDMAKLHIGALGTLGVIVRASFKVAPLPAKTRTLVVKGADPKPLAVLAMAVRDAGIPVTGLALARGLQTGEGGWTLLARLAGSEAAVERSAKELARLAGVAPAEAATDEAWADVAGAIALGRQSGIIVRAGLRPSKAADLIEMLNLTRAAVLAYPTVATAYARWPAPDDAIAGDVAALRTACAAGGGALVVEAAPTDLKAALDVWGPPRPDFALMRNLKAAMDPRVILNRGRYLGRI